MTQRDHDRGEGSQTIFLFVRDQDAQMLVFRRGHVVQYR